MNRFKFKKFGRTLLLLSAVASLVLTAVVWFGCGGGDNNPADNNSESGSNTHVHDWGAWSVTTQPTCAAQGVETRTCKLDATHKETQAVAKLTGAVCETGGAHVHDWGEWAVTTQPTCDAAGVETRTCKLDATHKETREAAKLTGAACQPSVNDNNCGIDGTANSCKTVKIGDQTWMAENLNTETDSSWCLSDKPQYCRTYGRLYAWSAAMAACPKGWHLPSRDEWRILGQKAGNYKDGNGNGSPGGAKLKSEKSNGTNDFEFSALMGGYRSHDGGYVSSNGYWWTSTDDGTADYRYAYYRKMERNDDKLSEGTTVGRVGHSVRCLEGESKTGDYPSGGVVDPSTVVKSEFTDDRDDKTYKTVKIGSQTWMAENLNYGNAMGNTYGNLYYWETAKAVCPTGWHLPTRKEWGTLARAVGGIGDYGTDGTAGKKLRAATEWYTGGTDDYGFSAMPGGYYNVDKRSYERAGSKNGGGFWWTATVTESFSSKAYARTMAGGDKVEEGSFVTVNSNEDRLLFSVRCIMDE